MLTNQFNINYLQQHHLMRVRHIYDKHLYDFSTNDYLSIRDNTQIKKAFMRGAEDYGLGSGGSALLSGYTPAHQQLEEVFADFMGHEKALLFSSGYLANIGVITTFANQSTILADKFCHASLVDGIALANGNCKRFKHSNLEHLTQLLQKYRTDHIVTESVFSINGNQSDLTQLAGLASSYNAKLIIDDAHGVGIFGKSGSGSQHHFKIPNHLVTCIIAPLGKAFASTGAIVAGNKNTIEQLIQFARTYRYDTSLPPAICVATIAALNIIQTEHWRREKLFSLINSFINEAQDRQLDLLSTDKTPIKSIRMPSNEIALIVRDKLLKKQFLVSCIRPPTAPLSCLRISLNAMQEEWQIIQLLDYIAELLAHAKTQNQKSI